MQWQQMDWPVLADPYNELGIRVVPITLLLDQSGIIRYRKPSPRDLANFLKTDYPSKAKPPSKPFFSKTIKLLEEEPETGINQFQLGVAYRQRFDSPSRQPHDFRKAIEAWRTALTLNPNQYIWRRRIQQYGPRLDKPYSFYDWVTRARQEITARGQTPIPLTAEPSGSELAQPKESPTPPSELPHPDPQSKLSQDTQNHIQVLTTAVPSTRNDRPAFRVHLQFTPNSKKKVHWTNDAGPLSFFPTQSDHFTIHDLSINSKVPSQPTTSETRTIDFEVRPVAGKPLPESIDGSAFYYICLGKSGECQFLRRNLKILLK